MTDTTNPWLQFLVENGAEFDPADMAQMRFAGFDPEAPSYFAPLTDLGLIAVTGEDAADFLHNQITNDVLNLSMQEARLAGYCTAKGRLLATFLMWRRAETIYLELPRAILPAIQKRLQMFVLRSKVKLADVSDQHVILGLGGAAAGVLAALFPSMPAAPYDHVAGDDGSLIRVADADGTPRYQWITDAATAKRLWQELIGIGAPTGPQRWRRDDIHAGIPQVTAATQEQFVPQMINFEVVGGVNFRKGCYPGQEIVARSQYLGKLKRRMVRASIDAAAAAGNEVFSSADPDQPCGMVVNAERNPDGGTDALVELKTALLDAGTLHLGAAGGPALRIEDLPYALPADAA
ncbi:folate-binding protein [Oxalobacteraceae bacterium OM1]|nr:folate-binding protein [Oxalobacteraceae bacterium OM1]